MSSEIERARRIVAHASVNGSGFGEIIAGLLIDNIVRALREEQARTWEEAANRVIDADSLAHEDFLEKAAALRQEKTNG